MEEKDNANSQELESRSRYEVASEFEACRVQDSEGYAPEKCVMRQGWILFADLKYWKGKQWEGQDAVQFYFGTTCFYTHPDIFANSTHKAILHSGG